MNTLTFLYFFWYWDFIFSFNELFFIRKKIYIIKYKKKYLIFNCDCDINKKNIIKIINGKENVKKENVKKENVVKENIKEENVEKENVEKENLKKEKG